MIRAALLFAVITCAGVAQNPADSDGFQSLFNGRDLTGWIGDQAHWTVADGILRGLSEGASAALIFDKQEFADFELRFEFRVLKGAGSIKVRGPAQGPVGVEFEIGSSGARWLVNGSQVFVAANVKTGDWDEYRLICKGGSFHAVQNGVEFSLGLVVDHLPAGGRLAIRLPAGMPSEIELRNIRVKE